jgi:hypothetical protein
MRGELNEFKPRLNEVHAKFNDFDFNKQMVECMMTTQVLFQLFS